MERLGDLLKPSVEALSSEKGAENCPYCGKPIKYREERYLGRVFKVAVACPCRIEDEKEQMKRIRLAERQAEMERLFPSDVGERFDQYTFQNWMYRAHTQACADAALKYAKEFGKHAEDGKGLLFYGRPGNGKSHLMGAIVHEVQKEERICVARSLVALFTRVKQTYDTDSKVTEAEVLSGLSGCDLLLLDDLGADLSVVEKDGTRTMTPWGESTLYNIVDDRYRHKKPTLFTTNCTLKELQERVGDRTYSRLEEMCDFYKNGGSDFRHETGLVVDRT